MSVNVTTLDNGLRIVSDRMESVETVSVGAWVEAGTRDEPAAINGISHVLEHMAFKGTQRRDAYAIAEEIEAVGGHLNAYTSREHTAYYAKILKDDLNLAIDLLSDILQHSVMDEVELSREQAVIVQEIHQAHDTPDDIVFDHFQETAYPNQSMGRPVLGTAELVEGLTREDVLDYMRGYYSAPRIIISAAGKLDHDAFAKSVEIAFDSLPDHNDIPREQANYTGGEFREARPLEQVHVLFGMDGILFEDPDFHAASAFSTLFGGGMSSRLFQEVREKRGLAYSIYSFLSCFSDGGMFGVYAGTGEREAEQLMPLICDEFEKVCGDVSEDEVTRARTQLKAGMMMALESTSSRCEQLARQMAVFGRPIPLTETIAKIDAVDATSVRRVAARLYAGPPTLTSLGPAGDLMSVESLTPRLN